MPPTRNYMDHEWTDFEEKIHTMLCLITKGVHLEGYGKGKRTDDPGAAKKNAYLTFATTLNDALHGTDYEHDIHKKEVTRMLDYLLLKHKAIVGKGGLAERQPGGRVTRALRLAFQRSLGAADPDRNIQPRMIPSPLDFDGSISEWNQWRRKVEERKRRARLGLPPLEDANEQGAAVEEVTGSPSKGKRDGKIQKPPSQPGRNKWRSQQNALSEEYVVDEVDQGKVSTIASGKTAQTNLDSFRVLPAGVRSASKYQWAQPVAPQPAQPDARQQAFLGGLRGAAAISAFQNPGAESSQASGEKHENERANRSLATPRSRSRPEPFIQPKKTRTFHAGRKYSATHARGSSGFIPGLTQDDSSDDAGQFTNTPVAGAALHRGIQSSGEMIPVDSGDKAFDFGVPSSKSIAREQGSSTEGALEEGEVEMDIVDEEDLWGEMDAARGFQG